MNLEQIFDLAINGLTIATSVVGSASLMVQALARIAHITPSDWDNRALNKAGRAIALIQAILDRIALNLDSSRARK